MEPFNFWQHLSWVAAQCQTGLHKRTTPTPFLKCWLCFNAHSHIQKHCAGQYCSTENKIIMNNLSKGLESWHDWSLLTTRLKSLKRAEMVGSLIWCVLIVLVLTRHSSSRQKQWRSADHFGHSCPCVFPNTWSVSAAWIKGTPPPRRKPNFPPSCFQQGLFGENGF